jgi:hypothetical protein
MKIPVNKILWSSIFIIAVILAVHSFFVLSPHFINTEFPEFLIERFNIDAEANIPTWFSTILLFFVSVTAFFIHRLKSGRPGGRSRWNKIWLGLGTLYLFLSLDEAAQIHELINRLTDVKWVFIYAPVFGTIFLVFVYYFFVVIKENHEIRNWILGGLVVFALGGLLFEWINYTYHLRYALRQISYVLEEGFEMIGTAMVLTGCLLELNKQFDIKYQVKDIS